MIVGEADSFSYYGVGSPSFPGTGVNTSLLIALSIILIGAGSTIIFRRKTEIANR